MVARLAAALQSAPAPSPWGAGFAQGRHPRLTEHADKSKYSAVPFGIRKVQRQFTMHRVGFCRHTPITLARVFVIVGSAQA